MKERAFEDVTEYPVNPPWTMFFDGPLYQKYDEFMKTKDFSQILLNTKLMLANSRGPEVSSASYSIGDDQWNKEYDADPTGSTYQYVSYDFHRRNKEDAKRRTRRTRAFILLGIVIMAAVALGTALVFHYFFIPPLEERNPINSVNVSFSGNSTSADLSGIEQTTQLDDHNEEIKQMLDALSDGGPPNDHDHDHEHVLNPDGKIFDDLITATTTVHLTDDTLTSSTTITPSTSTDAVMYELHLKPERVGPDDDVIVASNQDQSTIVTPKQVQTANTTAETVLTTHSTDTQTYRPLVKAEQNKLYTYPTTKVTEDIDKQYTSTATTVSEKKYPQYSSTATLTTEEKYPQYTPTATTGTEETYPQYTSTSTTAAEEKYPQYTSTTPTEEKYVQYTSTATTATEEKYPQYTTTTIKVTVGKGKPYTSTMAIDPMDFFGMDEYFTTTDSAGVPDDLIAMVDMFPTTESSVPMSQSTYSALSEIQGNTIEESPMSYEITSTNVVSTEHSTTQQTPTHKALTTETVHNLATADRVDTLPITETIAEINTTAPDAQPITVTLDLVVQPHQLVDSDLAEFPSTTTIKPLSTESVNDITTFNVSTTQKSTDGDTIVTTLQSTTSSSDLVVRLQTSADTTSTDTHSATTITPLSKGIVHDSVTDNVSTTAISTDNNASESEAQSTTPSSDIIVRLQTSTDVTLTDTHTITTITALEKGIVNDSEAENVSTTGMYTYYNASDSGAQTTTTSSNLIVPFQTSVITTTADTSTNKTNTTVSTMSTQHKVDTIASITTAKPMTLPETSEFMQETTTDSSQKHSMEDLVTTEAVGQVLSMSSDSTVGIHVLETPLTQLQTTVSQTTLQDNISTPVSLWETTESSPGTTYTLVETSITPETTASETTTSTSTTTTPATTTLPENYNMVQMHDVTSYTFENAKIICRVLHAIRWQSLSIKINQEWRPLEVTLHPSGKIKWSSSKTKHHDVIYDITNSTDGTGSNMTLSLLIEDVQCGDANAYICTLESEILDQSAMSDLIVVGKPSNKVKLTLGPSVIEDRALRITASWQGGYPIPWANLSWTAIDVHNKSYNLAEYGEYRDYELHEDHKSCQTTLKHSIVVFPKKHLNHTTVIVKPNVGWKRYFVDKSMEKYLHDVQPGIEKILVIPLDYCQNGKKDMSIPHPYTPCTKFVRCLPGDLVVQLCPRGTCFSEKRQQCA